MAKSKRFKDPIYGYINIDEQIVEQVVDTAEFQRLRDIVQTSYAPVYSSAVHNRFVHSIGVYHLGHMVTNVIRNNESIKNRYERFLYLFELACLLHDVGHSPFSHTGEAYYLDNGSRENLHLEIAALTNDNLILEEIRENSYKAAPHELMSVIVSLKEFGSLFENDDEKNFFARCITGYTYTKNEKDNSLRNCLISFLNSSVIDVDKLDYLIRDAYITGFETVKIDYDRLLSCIRICQDSEGTYKVAYNKGAISVIENVVYAHDAERKWIQNHPIVQYEIYLLTTIISEIRKQFGEDSIFSYDSLTSVGKNISDRFTVRLLSDSDLLFLMKNLNNNDYVNEYFCRNKRRHPLWKSESEYKAIFDTGFTEDVFEIMENEFIELSKYLNFLKKSQEINDDVLVACNKDIDNIQRMASEKEISSDQIQTLLKAKKKHMKWMMALKEFALEQEIDFDFVILQANQFNSGFLKDQFWDLQIQFIENGKTCDFGKVTNVLRAEKSERKTFYYIYYRKAENKNLKLKKLAKRFLEVATDERYEE